jgi:hypothetical protein
MTPRGWVIALVVGGLIWLAIFWTIAEKGTRSHTELAVVVSTTLAPPTTTTTTAPVPPTNAPSTSMPRSHETAPIVASEGDGIWHALAACESGGRWHIFDSLHSGGLQFAYATWRQAGGTRYASAPHLATPGQQIQIAREWLRRTSPRQWPVCGPRVGLTMAAAA